MSMGILNSIISAQYRNEESVFVIFAEAKNLQERGHPFLAGVMAAACHAFIEGGDDAVYTLFGSIYDDIRDECAAFNKKIN